MEAIKKISTLGLSKDEWLALRRQSIGGSDAAAIVGLNNYASPFSVWAEKTGRTPEREDSEAMRQGRDFEEYVAQRFTEATGKKVRRCNAILYNPTYPWAHANIDRQIVGEDAGLECKTTSVMNLKRFKNGEFPESYYVQCVHYMAITGAKKWYLAVLVLNTEFMWFEIARDEDEIKALMESEAAFWKFVCEDAPPAVDGSEATTDALKAVYPASDGTTINLLGFNTALAEIETLDKQIDALEKIKQGHINGIKAFMGEAEKATCGVWTVSYKTFERTTLDTKALRSTFSMIDFSRFETTKPTRQFRIYKKEEAN